jgi:hypothetical protein
MRFVAFPATEYDEVLSGYGLSAGSSAVFGRRVLLKSKPSIKRTELMLVNLQSKFQVKQSMFHITVTMYMCKPEDVTCYKERSC